MSPQIIYLTSLERDDLEKGCPDLAEQSLMERLGVGLKEAQQIIADITEREESLAQRRLDDLLNSNPFNPPKVKK